MFEKKEKRLPDPTAVATNGVRKEDEEGFRANPIGIDFIFFPNKAKPWEMESLSALCSEESYWLYRRKQLDVACSLDCLGIYQNYKQWLASCPA